MWNKDWQQPLVNYPRGGWSKEGRGRVTACKTEWKLLANKQAMIPAKPQAINWNDESSWRNLAVFGGLNGGAPSWNKKGRRRASGRTQSNRKNNSLLIEGDGSSQEGPQRQSFSVTCFSGIKFWSVNETGMDGGVVCRLRDKAQDLLRATKTLDCRDTAQPSVSLF